MAVLFNNNKVAQIGLSEKPKYKILQQPMTYRHALCRHICGRPSNNRGSYPPTALRLVYINYFGFNLLS